ncbi:craniofacial development protein 2-like [Elysia marginata]|uniref:Craniofacial development protein 2-like n=1 Tax=Elysia marginata TaxID=1093978 RepID=A0AAV4HFM3_9GAST|nr:craniofacial development protein 2-like [Elysia marginata]
MYYSCREDGLHIGGVAKVLDKVRNKSLLEWEPVNDRIIRVRLYSKYTETTIVQCYAPAEVSLEENKDEFYLHLQGILTTVPMHDILMVLGDLNSKVGNNNNGFESNVGKHGLRLRNDNGQRFLNLREENDLIIEGTFFKYKKIHKETWNSPDGVTGNQIDHMAIIHRWRSSLQDVRAIRGGDIGSDHNLVLSKLKLKLRSVKKDKRPLQFDSSKLKNPVNKETFSTELSNHFHLLSDLPIDDLDEYFKDVQEAFTASSNGLLGYILHVNTKKPWISWHIWEFIEERKVLKQNHSESKGNNAADAAEKCKAKSKEVKASAKQGKRQFTGDKAKEAQTEASKLDTQTLYIITRKLTAQVLAKPQLSRTKPEMLSLEKKISALVGQNILRDF